MFHIPPGIDGYSSVVKYQALSKSGTAPATEKMCASAIVPMWQPKWTSQFQTLLAKYEGTVIVSLAGHTHTDDFRLLNSSGAKPEFVLISPAISPVYRQNPAFRVVTFATDGSLSDATGLLPDEPRICQQQDPRRVGERVYVFAGMEAGAARRCLFSQPL